VKHASDMLVECLSVGRLTNEFAAMAMEIGQRVINSDKKVKPLNRQDAFSRYCENLVKKWRNIKPEGNIKAYLSSMAYTSLQDEKRKFKSDYEKKANLFQHNLVLASSTEEKKKDIENTILEKLDIQSGHDMSKQERIVIRRECVRLYKLGITKYKIAKHLGLQQSTVKRWMEQYEKEGKAFIFKDKRRKGKRNRISR
jgi:DNA-directed RNA polymerase specialized sigma24 family protein